MKEVIDLVVSYDTSFEDIELLRLEMENFVRHSDNSRDFQPDITISVAGVGDLDKLQLKIAIKHKSNWHNEAVRATRRSKFMCALALALKKVPIYGPGGGNEPLGGPLNPSYSVAVTDEFAAAKRKEAADNKEAKRMVPTAAAAQAGSDTNATSKSETKTSEEHNASNPVADASDNYGYDRHGEGVRAGDNLLERHGTNDADSVRRDHLARESQRGRRRAGETLPPMPLGQSSGVSVGVTPASPRMHNATFASQASRTGSSRSAPPFDPEAQTGVRPPIQPQHQPMAQGPAQPALYPVGGSAAMPGQAAGAAGQQSYLSGQPNPLQSAPSTAAPGSNVPGNQPPGTFRH